MGRRSLIDSSLGCDSPYRCAVLDKAGFLKRDMAYSLSRVIFRPAVSPQQKLLIDLFFEE